MSKTPSPAALEAHEAACRRGEAGYIDPTTQLFVMTSLYLLQRGQCCGQACRHCPWPPSAQRDSGRDESAGAWPWEPARIAAISESHH